MPLFSYLFMAKIFTLCFIINQDNVLLKKQARNIGAGKWNGSGGKVDEGESIEQACIREVKEETGLKVSNLFYHGTLEYIYDGKSESHLVHLFSTKTFSGTPRSTEEGEVKWFKISDIPYSQMWDADHYWLTAMLNEKKFNAILFLNSEGKAKLVQIDPVLK